MSNPSRFIKSSKIHQALDVLSHLPLTEAMLKIKISYTASVPRFNQHVIIPLMSANMIKREETLYKITKEGEEMLESLGRIKVKLPSSSRFVPVGSYDGKELAKSVERIGADDHFKIPSRRDNVLYYRNGTVEAV